ncbi:hypothetical protein [uncultured Clostridium sp.]|uniref:hypothetical protein n=1 Tax=uncultured Clostridium sp. TaxID=59620 RepID=UPI0028EE2E71|nr:hypothetical protein [uncultured Clostridium sp.]
MELKLKNLQLTISISENGESKEQDLEFFKALDDSDFNMDYKLYYVVRSKGVIANCDWLDSLVITKGTTYNSILLIVFGKMLGEKLSISDLLDKEKIPRIIERKLHLTTPIVTISELEWKSMKSCLDNENDRIKNDRCNIA